MSSDVPLPGAARDRARCGFASGARLAIPIVIGYVPIGLAYGVIARHSGLSPAEVTLMSILVFAGSAQFIACGLLASGAAATAIVGTTFLVNLRHVLFSMSLIPRLRHVPRPILALISFGITDESYGVAVTSFPPDEPADWRAVAGLNVTAYAAWVATSFAGAVLGGAVRDGSGFGIDFALPGMFICLLAMQLDRRTSRIVAIVAGAAGVAVGASPLRGWNIVVATLVAASVGALIDARRSTSTSASPSKAT